MRQKYSDNMAYEVLRLRLQNLMVYQICEEMGMPRTTVRDIVNGRKRRGVFNTLLPNYQSMIKEMHDLKRFKDGYRKQAVWAAVVKSEENFSEQCLWCNRCRRVTVFTLMDKNASKRARYTCSECKMVRRPNEEIKEG